MEINVGEYVRTKCGVRKIESYNYHEELPNNSYDFNKYHIYKQDITKHSKDIIDLIEVGDAVIYEGHIYEVVLQKIYINQEPVKIIKVLNSEEELCYLLLDWLLKENKIQGIITKEQFTQNAYVLEKER